MCLCAHIAIPQLAALSVFLLVVGATIPKGLPSAIQTGATSSCWLVLGIQVSYIESDLLLVPYLWLRVRKRVDASED